MPRPPGRRRPRSKRRRGKTIVEVIRNQGFGAIQGVGGFVDLAVDSFQLVHRTAIYAPPPYKNSMKMLVLPNGADFTPEPWVPRDVATYTTFYVDVLNAFDNFGPLFDELFGEGEKGVWEDVLEGMEKDPNGPNLNLRKELILQPRAADHDAHRLPVADHHDAASGCCSPSRRRTRRPSPWRSRSA